MPSVPILDWALWIIDCYSCWSDQRITTTGLRWVEADALCWLDNVGLLFHLSNTDPQSELLALSVMVQVFTEEEGDPRERKQEAEIEDELKSRSLGWWIVILLCWCQWLPMHAHHEPFNFNYTLPQQYCFASVYTERSKDQSRSTDTKRMSIPSYGHKNLPMHPYSIWIHTSQFYLHGYNRYVYELDEGSGTS